MTPIILPGPPQACIEFPADHLNHDLSVEQVPMTYLRYITIGIAADSPLPLALYWDSLLTRIADTHPDRKVVILLRAAPCIEALDRDEGVCYRLRARLATIPDMGPAFWQTVEKEEGTPLRYIIADGSLL